MKRFFILFLIFFITCGNTSEISTIETTTTTHKITMPDNDISVTTTTNVCESYTSVEEKNNCYQSQQSKKSKIIGEDLIFACENSKEYIYASLFYDYYSSNAFVIELKTIELYQAFESGWYGRGNNPIDKDYVNQFYDADYFDVGLGINPDYEKGKFSGLKDIRLLNDKAWSVISDSFDILKQKEGVGSLVRRQDSKGFSVVTLLFSQFIINEYADIYYETNPDLSHLNFLYENYLQISEDFQNISDQINNFNCSNLSSYTP